MRILQGRGMEICNSFQDSWISMMQKVCLRIDLIIGMSTAGGFIKLSTRALKPVIVFFP